VSQWVTAYNLQCTTDGFNWTPINKKELRGNSDKSTVQVQTLDKPARCRAIRVLPTEWNKGKCMRLEVVIADTNH